MPTVLVVDDSVIDRRLAGNFVEKRRDLTATDRSTGHTAVFAANGREALTLMEAELPAAVVTDLQMPEMDGLELVETIKSRFPTVPVILMTAHGSEDIAIKALQRGAASYVPKRDLARQLLSTLESVLEMALADRHHHRMLQCLSYREARFLLDNDPALIPPLVAYLEDDMSALHLCHQHELIRVAVALREALTNAMLHGNLELSSSLREIDDRPYIQLAEERRALAPFSDRKVEVRVNVTPSEAVYIIRDEGPGFDPALLPDPTDPANMDRPSGRGLLLMQTFMDEVRHNERGNEIRLVKRRCE